MDKKQLLRLAYQSPDPQKFLERILVVPPTRAQLEDLIPRELHGPWPVVGDLAAYWAQCEDSVSPEAWKCRYMYFATAMCHIFDDCMTVYSDFNRPIPYLWLRLDPGSVSLISHGRWPKTRVKIMLHQCLTGRPAETEHYKFSVNLETGEVMPCSKGTFIHVSLCKGGVVKHVRGGPEGGVVALSSKECGGPVGLERFAVANREYQCI